MSSQQSPPLPPHTHFIKAIAANINYWQAKIGHWTDTDMANFLQEQANLLIAVEMGLVMPETRGATAELLLTAFPFIERCGTREKWLPLWETAVSQNVAPIGVLPIKLLNRLGQLLRLGNQLEQAIAIHQKSQTLATQLQNKQALAEAWFNLSEIYRLKREYEKAETYGQKALAFFNCQTDQARWQATLLNTMGLIALDCDECLQAEARLRESVALWQLLDEPTELARVLKNLGLALQQQQKYIAAYQYYHEALEQLRRTESELDKALIILNIGTLHFVQGEYRQAELAFLQVNRINKQHIWNLTLQAMVAQNLGNSLLSQKRLVEAETYLQQAKTLWQQLGDSLNLANTLGTLGEVYQAQNAVKAAIINYDEALSLLTEYPEHPWATKLRHNFTNTRASLRQVHKKSGQLAS